MRVSVIAWTNYDLEPGNSKLHLRCSPPFSFPATRFDFARHCQLYTTLSEQSSGRMAPHPSTKKVSLPSPALDYALQYSQLSRTPSQSILIRQQRRQQQQRPSSKPTIQKNRPLERRKQPDDPGPSLSLFPAPSYSTRKLRSSEVGSLDRFVDSPENAFISCLGQSASDHLLHTVR